MDLVEKRRGNGDSRTAEAQTNAIGTASATHRTNATRRDRGILRDARASCTACAIFQEADGDGFVESIREFKPRSRGGKLLGVRRDERPPEGFLDSDFFHERSRIGLDLKMRSIFYILIHTQGLQPYRMYGGTSFIKNLKKFPQNVRIFLILIV